MLGLQRGVGVADFGSELRFRNEKEGAPAGDYVPVDFKKHAESMGALSIFATTSSEVKAALEQARNAARISVVVVPVEPESRMPGMATWWDVPVEDESSVDRTKTTRTRYDVATKKPR